MNRRRVVLPSNEELGDRARAVVVGWEARIRKEIRPGRSAVATLRPGSHEQATAQLHEQASALDEEIGRVERSLSDLRVQRGAAEQRAMLAIRAADDRAAKVALDEQSARVEAETLLEADLTVLCVMSSECRRVLEPRDHADNTPGVDSA